VRLDGRICRPEQRIVILINKPRGVLCTCRDPQGRRTFRDLLPDPRARLYPVGRLDRDSEGLLIVTNDGELAQALAHPRHEVPKVYHATVRSAPSREQMQRLREGVLADGRLLKAETIEPMGRQRDETEYRIVLREGHKRQIRRMFDAVGVRVVRLQRVAIGPLNMGGLRPGQWRHMTQAELTLLRRPPENRDGDAGRI
jgi:pseudouridine synthase